MADNVQETRPPEPPPKPPEVPKPTEQSRRPRAPDHDGSTESQQSAQQNARDAAQSEYAKATSGGEPHGLRPTPRAPTRLDTQSSPTERDMTAPRDSTGTHPPQDLGATQSFNLGDTQRSQDAAPTARLQDSQAGRQPQDASSGTINDDRDVAAPAGEQAAEHAAARQAAAAEWAKATESLSTPMQPTVDADDQRQPATAEAFDLKDQPPTAQPDNTETDESAETATRISELRDQGHGPQRHHDPSNEQLAARMGDPILDPQTGRPELKGNGHVKAENHIDPMTGTTVDGVHGGTHRCGDYATRFDSAEDYVAADRFMRQRIGDTGAAVARVPISEVLGPEAHQRMTG